MLKLKDFGVYKTKIDNVFTNKENNFEALDIDLYNFFVSLSKKVDTKCKFARLLNKQSKSAAILKEYGDIKLYAIEKIENVRENNKNTDILNMSLLFLMIE